MATRVLIRKDNHGREVWRLNIPKDVSDDEVLRIVRNAVGEECIEHPKLIRYLIGTGHEVSGPSSKPKGSPS